MKSLRSIFWSAVAILLGVIAFGTRACAQELYDAPQPVKPAVTFWTFRGVEHVNGKKVFNWNAPAIRSNRDMLHSKLYLASQIGGAIAMVIACRNKRSGEAWGSEVPAVLAVDGTAYLGGRFFTQSFSVGQGIYQMVHYGLAATK